MLQTHGYRILPSRMGYLIGSLLLTSAACTGGNIGYSEPDTGGGGGNAGGKAQASGGSIVIPIGGTAGSWVPINNELCGNGKLDGSEECDDTNDATKKVGGDGCSVLCQLEVDYECPEVGKPCKSTAKCGDGKQSATEACDDSNILDGDGCSKDCLKVESGWQCRVPGKRCAPLCGDGVLTSTEQCDDKNDVVGDGCSSTCQVEPGWSCADSKTPCVKSVCGNGKVEFGENCDLGASNGLFKGDGKGCSKTCTNEPTCRDAAGKNQACTTTCGDGNMDGGEECDDGNQVNGDGCTNACKNEPGFNCTHPPQPDTQPCVSNPAAQCLLLPVVVRDFKSQKETGGHPDFYYLGSKDASGKVKTWCVPDSGGPHPLLNDDSTARCWDIAAPELLNGKPFYNPARPDNTCACQFTDWSRNGNGGNVPGYLNSQSPLWNPQAGAWRSDLTDEWPGQEGAPRWRGKVTIVQDATSFSQWFTDNTFNTGSVLRTLELSSIATSVFQFSSPPHSVLGGFFPIDDLVTSEPKLCNLWPYWYPWPSCTGNQYLFPPGVATEGWVSNLAGKPHNSWFTTEVHYFFVYDPQGITLQFYGDDDLFTFINGKLVLDLGGVHRRLPGRVTVAGDPGVATIVEGGVLDFAGNVTPCVDTAAGNPSCRNRTIPMNMEAGKIYEISIFHADRHPTESNYQLTLSGFNTTRSICQSRCGDGIVSAGEECDEGEKNDDTIYGGCTKQCKFGPFCGDNEKNGDEECDKGKDNTATYGGDGCAPGCKKPHFCGDGIVDSGHGEACDYGVDVNGKQGSTCDANCRAIIY
jgi:fibro-slime domain-containing protein